MNNDHTLDQTYQPQAIIRPGDPGVYKIEIAGELAGDWSGWLNGLEIQIVERNRVPITCITGEIADQSALRGILTRLWNLNLSLLAVNRVENDSAYGTEESGKT